MELVASLAIGAGGSFTVTENSYVALKGPALLLSLTVILTVNMPAFTPYINRFGYFAVITVESLTDRETTDGVSVGSGSVSTGNLNSLDAPKSRVRSVRDGENLGGKVFSVYVIWNYCAGSV